MRTFTDSAGRTWVVNITTLTIKQVRALTGVDLLKVVEGTLLDQLANDAVLLVDVLYACCKDQADKLGLTDEQFGVAMAGDCIEQATGALLESVADFFPSRRRTLFHKALVRMRELDSAVLDEADRRLDEMGSASASLPPTATG